MSSARRAEQLSPLPTAGPVLPFLSPHRNTALTQAPHAVNTQTCLFPHNSAETMAPRLTGSALFFLQEKEEKPLV